MRKPLKQKIFDTVSTLQSLFAKLKDSGNRKTSEIQKLTKQVGEMETELKRCREKLAK
jgi:predicted  nucleic acid-binding Zn-ribbon protein